MVTGTELGEYLRARRERLRPEEFGLPAGGRRRTPGLRREEVAHLAGISPEYYMRLEQGRDRHPSEQVLESIAHALRFDRNEEAYLHDLARPGRPRRRRGSRAERVGDGVRALIDSWPLTPAVVQGPYLTTLAANRLAVALSPYFAQGVNTLRAAFLEPEMREFYRDWDAMTAKAVAQLRTLIGGGHEDDPRLAALIGELSLRSDRFRTLWARRDVRHTTSGVTLLRHPLVGDLDLRYEKFAPLAAPGQILVTYHAPPGTDSHERLLLLAQLATPATEPSRTAAPDPSRTAAPDPSRTAAPDLSRPTPPDPSHTDRNGTT
ncbi:helix-turn-helix domain-containing protein [Streptomyces sp. NPDC026672]|uniref:MmyB family transcriptional regulator n=1 Tax=unclassified Streptomyces TaxID=2593676 RepID=UPI0033E6E466